MKLDELKALAERATCEHPLPYEVERTPRKRKFVAIVDAKGFVIPTTRIGEYLVELLNAAPALLAVVEAAVRWADSETACAETLSGTATAERRTIASVHWKTLDALRDAIDNLERNL